MPSDRLRLARRRSTAGGKNKVGRPKVGKGAKRVLLSIEGGLLHQIDRFAANTGISRSQLFARGVKLAMATPAGEKSSGNRNRHAKCPRSI